MRYEAVRYAADGHAGEWDPLGVMTDGAVLARGSLQEVRQAILARIESVPCPACRGEGASQCPACHGSGSALWWYGESPDETGATVVEAYHESMHEGCGGWYIRAVQEE
jgi:RecJ-like exonuclease